MHSWVLSLLEDKIAEEILSGNIREGDTVNIKKLKDKSELTFTVSKPKTAAKGDTKKTETKPKSREKAAQVNK